MEPVLENPIPADPLIPPQKKSWFQNKILLFGGVLLILCAFVIGVLLFFLSSSKKPVVVETPKTWQIKVAYDSAKDSLSLSELKLLDKQIVPDYRSAKFSEYSLNVISSQGKVLYTTKIVLQTDILDGNMLMDPPPQYAHVTPPEANIKSAFYAPYFDDGQQITIVRSGKVLLTLKLPGKKKVSFLNLPHIASVYAADTCSPLQVVFVSDGYSNMAQYHTDVQEFEQAFIQTAPYSTKSPSMFDFKIVDNNQPIGCSSNGLISCMQDTTVMDEIARAQYPNFSKVVVIANAPEQNPKDQGVLGISSGIGGNYAAFPNNSGNVTQRTLIVARHELLGHAVGLLYDRYVTTSFSYGRLVGSIRSNCTDNPSGEAFWADAGLSQTSLGCGNPALYAPTEPSCQPPSNPQLKSGGTPASVMSAVGCGGPNFDPVEQMWITNNILTDYEGCTPGSTIATPPPVGGGITPAPTVAKDIDSIVGKVFNDQNNNSKYDAGEQGISGTTLTLIGGVGGSTQSDSNGAYSFTKLAPGDYSVKLTYLGQSVTSDQATLSIFLSSPPEIDFGVHITNNGGPIIVPVTPIATPIPTITPIPSGGDLGGPGGSGGFAPNGTPIPTPDQYFTCTPDPSCTKNKNIQLCPLICNPQP